MSVIGKQKGVDHRQINNDEVNNGKGNCSEDCVDPIATCHGKTDVQFRRGPGKPKRSQHHSQESIAVENLRAMNSDFVVVLITKSDAFVVHDKRRKKTNVDSKWKQQWPVTKALGEEQLQLSDKRSLPFSAPIDKHHGSESEPDDIGLAKPHAGKCGNVAYYGTFRGWKRCYCEYSPHHKDC